MSESFSISRDRQRLVELINTGAFDRPTSTALPGYGNPTRHWYGSGG